MAENSSISPLESLPAEILSQIFNYLDSPSYIAEHLDDSPASVFNDRGELKEKRPKPLKNASLACKRLRNEAVLRLYRHLHIRLPSSQAKAADTELAVTQFLEDVNNPSLISSIQDVTLFVIAPSKEDPFVEKVKGHVQALADLTRGDAFSIWNTAFAKYSDCPDFLEPLWSALATWSLTRFTFVGSSPVLQALLEGKAVYNPFERRMWSPRLRLLSVSCRDPDKIHFPCTMACEDSDGWDTIYSYNKVFRISPWTDVLINEGSALFKDPWPTDAIHAELFQHRYHSYMREDRVAMACVKSIALISRSDPHVHTGNCWAGLHFCFPNLRRIQVRTLHKDLEATGFWKRAEENVERHGDYSTQVMMNLPRVAVEGCVSFERGNTTKNPVIYEFLDVEDAGRWRDMIRHCDLWLSGLRSIGPGKLARGNRRQLDE